MPELDDTKIIPPAPSAKGAVAAAAPAPSTDVQISFRHWSAGMTHPMQEAMRARLGLKRREIDNLFSSEHLDQQLALLTNTKG